MTFRFNVYPEDIIVVKPKAFFTMLIAVGPNHGVQTVPSMRTDMRNGVVDLPHEVVIIPAEDF